MYPFAPSIPSLSVGRWTHLVRVLKSEGGNSEALLGLETGSVSPYSPPKEKKTKGNLGVGSTWTGEVSQTKTIKGVRETEL